MLFSFLYRILCIIVGIVFVSCGGGSRQAAVTLERVFAGLAFDHPVAMVQPPSDRSTWYVIEKAGMVFMFDNSDSVMSTTESLDIRSAVDDAGEGGLLGIAFHPSYSGSGDVFLYYTATGPDISTPLVSRISRFHAGSDGLIAPSSESVILSIKQPALNHNGGDIKFGPDGYLYIALGDGGGGGDPFGNSQDTGTLLGSILRIDVDGDAPYTIPAGNVFASSATDAPEIFAWGLRNPWRFSFDEHTGDLWAGDVGQGDWEEIDFVVTGGNYGWNVMEGTHCYPPGTACESTGFVAPVFVYGRSEGYSVTGGYVYRGAGMSGYFGHYIFADWGSGKFWSFDTSFSSPAAVELADTGLRPVSFAQDENLELYVLDYSGGGIYRLIKSP
jgi:glucose/arabinose dehydrogenase